MPVISRLALFWITAFARGRPLARPMLGGFHVVAPVLAPRQRHDIELYRGSARGRIGFQVGGSRHAEAPAPISDDGP